ncbi:MAG TPA: hypothetical protein VGO78_23100 [Acidimicrobiales bacterium]|nr:hypothetical protein [Acidimicrobiales bacterium]
MAVPLPQPPTEDEIDHEVETDPVRPHEYVSFDDPEEERTWVFDLTFLTSNWTCIFGQGCPGVLTAPAGELEQGCCSYGAHLVDDEDAEAVAAAAERLGDGQWQFRSVALRKGSPLRTKKDGSTVTRLVDDACIFLNRPGFAGGAGCALHRAALDADERPLDWKPDVCWQVPLRRVDHTDDDGHVTSTLREWKRRDWGEGGHEFHWWCTDAPDAFVGHTPVHREMRDEIIELVGEQPYAMVAAYLDARLPKRKGNVTFLPHPALRA